MNDMNDSKLVHFKINGKDASAPDGTYITKAAELNGVDIPVFCGYDKLKPWAGCRICLVDVGLPRTIERDGQKITEIAKMPKLQAACAMPICEGMEVWTETDAAVLNRKQVLEFLLINHPLECPVCDKGGECPLQDITFKYGLDKSRMQEPKRVIPDADVNEFVRLNYKRCIHCKRCVRFHDEIAGDHLLEFGRRGSEMFIQPKEDDGFKSKFSGNQVEFCPVGALTSRPYRFLARDWELLHTPTVSLADATGTNMMIHHRLGRIMRYWNRDNAEVDWGWLSDKDRFVYEQLYSEERLKKPLIRQSDGSFREAGWREAVTYIVDNLKMYIDRDGGASISGIAGSRLSNEVYASFRRLLTARIRTPRYHFGPHIPGLASDPTDFLKSLLYDSTSWENVTHSDAILAWGVDLLEEAPVLALKIERDMEAGGAILLTANSHKTEGERFATARYHFPLRKQADALKTLANAIADPSSVPDEMKPLLEYLLGANRVAILAGNEVLGAPNAAELVSLILAVRNNLRVKRAKECEGGAPEFSVTPCMTFNPIFRDGNSVGALLFNHMTYIAASRDDEHEGECPGLDGILNGMASGDSGFCYVIGADPVKNFPDSSLAIKAFEKCQFVVVQDQFMTETARRANVILPALAAVESEGTVLSGEKRLQKLHQADVHFAGADSDFNILRKVLAEMGYQPRTAIIGEYFEGIAARMTALLGTTYDSIPDTGVLLEFGVVSEEGKPVAPTEFIKFDAPGSLEDSAGKDGNLLVLIPKLYMFNGENHSIRSEHFAQAVGKPFCEISPIDASRLGIEDRSRVEIASRAGNVEVEARITGRVPTGHVLLSDSLPGKRFADLLTAGEHTVVNLIPQAAKVGAV